MGREYVAELVRVVEFWSRKPEVQSIQSDRELDALLEEINTG